MQFPLIPLPAVQIDDGGPVPGARSGAPAPARLFSLDSCPAGALGPALGPPPARGEEPGLQPITTGLNHAFAIPQERANAMEHALGLAAASAGPVFDPVDLSVIANAPAQTATPAEGDARGDPEVANPDSRVEPIGADRPQGIPPAPLAEGGERVASMALGLDGARAEARLPRLQTEQHSAPADPAPVSAHLAPRQTDEPADDRFRPPQTSQDLNADPETRSGQHAHPAPAGGVAQALPGLAKIASPTEPQAEPESRQGMIAPETRHPDRGSFLPEAVAGQIGDDRRSAAPPAQGTTTGGATAALPPKPEGRHDDAGLNPPADHRSGALTDGEIKAEQSRQPAPSRTENAFPPPPAQTAHAGARVPEPEARARSAAETGPEGWKTRQDAAGANAARPEPLGRRPGPAISGEARPAASRPGESSDAPRRLAEPGREPTFDDLPTEARDHIGAPDAAKAREPGDPAFKPVLARDHQPPIGPVSPAEAGTGADEALGGIGAPSGEGKTATGAAQISDPGAQARADLARGAAMQIAEVVRSSGERAVVLRLQPEELGRVSLTLSQDGGGLLVALVADRQDTLDLLRRHIELLGQELRRLGYEGVSFSFAGGGQDQGRESTGRGGESTAGESLATMDPDTRPEGTQTRPQARNSNGSSMDIRI